MKLAALQLMQQKASKQESSSPSLENGGSPTTPFPEDRTEGGKKSPLEDGKMEEDVAGLDQVKELTETIASQDGAGVSASEASWVLGGRSLQECRLLFFLFLFAC